MNNSTIGLIRSRCLIRILLYFLFLLTFTASLVAQYKSDAKEEMGKLGAFATSYYHKISKGEAPPEPEKANAPISRTFTGEVTGNYFGGSIASAGDVNGDGYADIIVGAYAYVSNTGRAYIYFGGPGMDNTPDVIITGEATGYRLGISVSTAGDVNGDGYADVIVGADSYSSSTGRAYIYYGGASMNNIADVTMTGEISSSNFGKSVAAAGDVNGDGYSDVIVGAYLYSSSKGRAYIFYGGPGMNNIADVTMTGEATTNRFGTSVSSAGDVNGDGYADVIVGANYYSSNTGRAYIFFGGSTMDNTADVTMTGETTNNNLGYSVSTAGDANGDGYDDVIVGAYGYSSITGRAYIYYGGTSMDNIADVTMSGETTNNFFGIAVSAAGDVNGDGYSDVIIGAYGYSSYTGRAYVYYGSADMNNICDGTMTGEGTSNYFGIAVSTAGDVNGDGYADVIVGADRYSTNTGRMYLYSWRQTNTPDERFTGESIENFFGWSISTAGDVNGDGYTDVIVGAPWDSNITGRAYIFLGGPSMDNIADVTMTGEDTLNLFGYSVSAAGDVNRDGYADVIVGAPSYASEKGRAYIFFGGASMNSSADVTMTGEATGDGFGISVSNAGDVNGDGYSDVLVSAVGYSSYTGRTYIYFGGSSMNNTADVIMTGVDAGVNFGYSVSSAGDVNGDGYADIIIGAYAYASNTGRAYIYYGGSSMNNTADVTLEGEETNSYFGYSVSSAGDVNGDGFSDVIVGAFRYSDYNGRVYIYFGGTSMDCVADITLSGEAEQNLGQSVSSAGDVNRDGYADVIIGSRERAHIIYGGSRMSNIDVTLYGEAIANGFGTAVSAAGDVNGDGYADVIVGAYPYLTLTGRVYLYLSWSAPIVPRIASVKDIPSDQGGKILVKWIRSRNDAKGINGISSYTIEQSRPAGATGFFWEEIASITPRNNPQYAYTATTPYDSMSGNSGVAFFRVTAQTKDPNQYWRSNIMSGYSVDNIPPVAPGGAAIAAIANGNISLSWNPNRTDGDVGGYRVFRSTASGFTPSDSNTISTTRDTTFIDNTSIAGEHYYYRIKTVDIHGNESIPSSELSAVALSVEVTIGRAPSVFELWQNYPNPFNPTTTIEFTVPSNGRATLKIFNAIGQEIATLFNGEVESGKYHQVQFNARGHASGLYFSRLEHNGKVQLKKMSLIK